jgi:hypothetical protein
MVCSPGQKFRKAIKPDVAEAKQLDDGIGHTFVSSVRERLDRSKRWLNCEKADVPQARATAVDTKVSSIPSSNCAPKVVLA